MASLQDGNDAVITRLTEEKPPISEAVSNFFQMKTAEGLAGSVTVIPSAVLQQCAKVLLVNVNSYEMPDPVEWQDQQEAELRAREAGTVALVEGRDAPVGGPGPGAAAAVTHGVTGATKLLERLGEYKGLFHLVKLVKEKGGKPTKLLGRSYLRTIWPGLSANLKGLEEAAARKEPGGTEGVGGAAIIGCQGCLTVFLEQFEAETMDDGSLFWRPSMGASVQEQSAQRMKEAQERFALMGGADTALSGTGSQDAVSER
jgi:hypothetical protein